MTQAYDQFYGRIIAGTAAATDTYAEQEITMPVVVATTSKASNLLVPVIKQVDFYWNSLSALSADALVACGLAAGPASTWTALVTATDPSMIALWMFNNCLTTSGEVIVPLEKSFVFPGDGLLITAPTVTLQQSNSATGISTWIGCRIWYDYVEMNESTYLRALHNMGF